MFAIEMLYIYMIFFLPIGGIEIVGFSFSLWFIVWLIMLGGILFILCVSSNTGKNRSPWKPALLLNAHGGQTQSHAYLNA